MTVRGAGGSSPSRVPGAAGEGSAPSRSSFECRREMLDLLRRYALHVETANVLEDRAGRCTSPDLAGVLRERAGARRRMAEGVLAELLRQGVPAVRRLPPDTGRERRGR